MILALLSLIAVLSFLGVSALSRLYHDHQAALGNRWFSRGVTDLQSRRYDRAIVDFRTALLYSRDNYEYRLQLAEALLGLKRIDEASTYFRNLWEREPENGLVNLELARIAVQTKDIEHALRYYHNAIYAAWPADQEARRRETRFELINYLLDIGFNTQAQSELIALAANVTDDPTLLNRIADLFSRAGDFEHALAEYRSTLKSDPKNPSALAGAGRAAFQLRQYELAENYLRAAVAADPKNASAVEELKQAQRVLQLDPFRRQLPLRERAQIARKAFDIAGERLDRCSGTASASTASFPESEQLASEWSRMKPQVSAPALQRHPELLESVMELSFRVERASATACPAQNEDDQALLLVSKLHEGNEPGTPTSK